MTTIEGLAAVVAEGFAEMHERFDVLEEKSDSFRDDIRELDARLAAVENKLSGVLRRLDDEAMERVDVRNIIVRMERIEQHLFGKKGS